MTTEQANEMDAMQQDVDNSEQKDTLETLAKQWRDVKRAEEEARKARVAVEESILAHTGCKEEGSQTFEAGEWKVRVTGKRNRTLDQAAWESIAPTIPEDMRPVEYAPKLDTKGLRYLENNEPDVYRRVCEAIVAKPAKPAVEVK